MGKIAQPLGSRLRARARTACIFVATVAVAVLAIGCTPLSGARFPREPDLATILDDGAIAIDSRSEMAFVLRPLIGWRGRIWAVPADGTPARPVVDLTEGETIQLAVAPTGLVLSYVLRRYVSEPDSEQNRLVRRSFLELRDRQSYAVLHSTELDTGVVVPSADGRYLALFNQNVGSLRLLRSATFEVTTVDVEPTEFVFFHHSLRFAVLECGEQGGGSFSVWHLNVSDGQLQAERAFSRSFDDDCNSSSLGHLVIAPDDRTAAYVTERDQVKDLSLVDLESGTLRQVPTVRGPVAFSADASHIIGWRGDPWLVIMDAATLVEQKAQVWLDDYVGYYASPTQPYVVIGNVATSALGAVAVLAQRLVVYDLIRGNYQRMPGPGVTLDEFVAQPAGDELWLVDHEALFRLDLSVPTLDLVPTSFAPRNINRLPKRNWLVLDDAYAKKGTNPLLLLFYDPITRRVVRQVYERNVDSAYSNSPALVN